MSKTKLNFVLDLDATLVHTHGDVENFDVLDTFKKGQRIKLRKRLYTMKLYDVSVEEGTGEEVILSGIYRSYLEEFIPFLQDYCNIVIVWSAGRMKYVKEMCRKIFPINQPYIIYTYDDCDVGKGDYLKKPLKKLFEDPRLKGKGVNETNTFVLDDREDTFSLNKKNGIQIPEFESDLTAEEILFHPDNNLIKLMCWLKREEVINCRDVRELNKDEIFTKSLDEYRKELNSSKKSKVASPKRKIASPKKRKTKKKE